MRDSFASRNLRCGADLESPRCCRTARNIAIILALAAGVDFLPGGGGGRSDGASALTLIFLAAIAWLLYRVYREQQLTLATLTDARKAGLFGAVGGDRAAVVAYDDFRSWSGGIVLWIALMAACVGVDLPDLASGDDLLARSIQTQR